MAVCTALGLLVTSNREDNTLIVFALPNSLDSISGAGAGLPLVCILGGASSPAPMRFRFHDGSGSSGRMAFTGPPTARLLLVTDAGHDAVHLVDVVTRTHAGYLASPGSIFGPRGMAASRASPLVAVSAWKRCLPGEQVVRLYRRRGGGTAWEAVWVIGDGLGRPGCNDVQLGAPYGLRFSAVESVICATDALNDRASVFRVGDGGFVRHIAEGLDVPRDVEELEGGWLVACWRSHSVTFVGVGDVSAAGGEHPSLGKGGGGDGEFKCITALAVVPGLGLVVLEEGNGGRLQVFATPDTIAMASMSHVRVVWLGVVARAVLCRQALARGLFYQ